MKLLKQTLLILFLTTLGTLGVFNYSKSVKDHGNLISEEVAEIKSAVNETTNALIQSQNEQNRKNQESFLSIMNNIDKNKISVSQAVAEMSLLESEMKNQILALDVKSTDRDMELLQNIQSVKKFYSDIQNEINKMQKIIDDSSGDNKELLYNKILYPTVRIGVFEKVKYDGFEDGIELVGKGSGSIIYSKKKIKIDAQGNMYASDEIDTYVLTCSHLSDRVYYLSHYEVHIFDFEGKYSRHKADRIANTNAYLGKDIMVLKLRDNKTQYKEADFIPEDEIKNITIGDEVINVGGGLGARPFPSFGYITGKYIESQRIKFLWQTQAPAIFGNSGGPVFTKDGKQIGIVVRIAATRGGSPMPHMAYFVPPDVIYDWLKSKDLDFILAD